MTLSEIKKIVEDKNNKINVEYSEDPGVAFCKKFLENNDYYSADKFMNIDIYEACKCIYYIQNRENKSLDEVCNFIDSFSNYFKTLDGHDITSFIDMIFYFAGFNDVDSIIDYLTEKSNVKARLLLNRFNFINPENDVTPEEERESNENHKSLLRLIRKILCDCDAVALLRAACENRGSLHLIMQLINVHKHMQEERDALLAALEDRYSIKSGTSESRKQVKGYFKDNFRVKDIISDMNIISSFVTSSDYEKGNYERKVLKEIRANNQAYEMLSKSAKRAEITDARSIVKRIKDEELKNIFLKYIYEHNKKYYVDLDERLQRYRGNTSTAYLDELSKHGIIVDSDEVKDFMFNNLDDFKKMLNILSKYSFSENDLISVLKITNIDLVGKIDEYIKKGMISLSFIKNNLDIYNFNNTMTSVIENNINILNNYGVNPQIFVNYPGVLLDETGILLNNIKLLIDYNLKGSLKTTNNFEFILDEKLAYKIDRMVELGFSSYLEEDLGLINSNNIKRLEVLKSMNIPIDDINKLRDVLFGQKFIINDNELDGYISNVLPYKNKKKLSCSVEDLEKNRLDKRTYSMGGVLISSQKVNRLINEGYDMYDAITHGLLLTEDEFNNMFGNMKQFII